MSIENGTPDGASIGVPAPAAPAATPAPDGAPPEPYRNVAEIQRALKGQRELAVKVDSIEASLAKITKMFSQEPAPTPAPADGLAQKALDELGQFKRSMAFRDALDSATLDPADKKLLKRLYDAEKPSDPEAWFTSAMADLPARGTPAAGQANAPGQAAPGRAPDGALPSDPLELARLRPDVWRAMSREDQAKAWKDRLVATPVQQFFKIPQKKG